MLQLDFSINFMDKSSTVSSSPGNDALSPALSRKHFQQPADGRWFPTPRYYPPSYKLNIRKYVVKQKYVVIKKQTNASSSYSNLWTFYSFSLITDWNIGSH